MDRNKRRKIMIIILILLNILIGFLVLTNKKNVKEPEVVEVVKTHEVGPYTLRSNQSDYVKTLDTELSSAVDSKDDEKNIEAVSKYFVADYFTLSNKKDANDVGGLELVLPSNKDAFEKNSIDSFYIDYPYFVKSYTKDGLPEVTDVSITSVDDYETKNIVDNKDNNLDVSDAKSVSVEITYKEVEGVEYQILDKTKIVVVKDDLGVWYVYEILGTQQ